jgi:hypothetical protein
MGSDGLRDLDEAGDDDDNDDDDDGDGEEKGKGLRIQLRRMQWSKEDATISTGGREERSR